VNVVQGRKELISGRRGEANFHSRFSASNASASARTESKS
jgi:hypothetical protein